MCVLMNLYPILTLKKPSIRQFKEVGIFNNNLENLGLGFIIDPPFRVVKLQARAGIPSPCSAGRHEAAYVGLC